VQQAVNVPAHLLEEDPRRRAPARASRGGAGLEPAEVGGLETVVARLAIDAVGTDARDHGPGERAEVDPLGCLTNVNDAPPQEHNAPLPHRGRTSLVARETLPTIEHLRFNIDRSKSRFQ
jgi:hypothetical protein